MIINSIASLDTLLRGVTNTKPLPTGEATQDSPAPHTQTFSIAAMLVLLVALAMFYGLCMGSYSLFKPLNPEVMNYSDRWLQMLASMIKVPLLYALTILVTFPSLYVFSALVGTQLNFNSFIRLMITLLAINLAVLASLGPIVAFFSVSTINYRFMQIFNVAMFAVAGGLGLAWLLQVIRDLSDKLMSTSATVYSNSRHISDTATNSESQSAIDNDESDSTEATSSTVSNRIDPMPVKWIFRIWIVAFCLVGSQLGWVLRPFIGNPEIAFTWFRARESNFFLALIDILRSLIS